MRDTLTALSARELLVDVILNDRESAELDCETLRDHASNVMAMAGSCVCCDALDELTDLVMKAAGTRHDALFVELNGTADPIPLLESFTLLESRFLLRPRWQICVIDARRFGKRGPYHQLELLQLETASHFRLSHTEDLSEMELADVRKRVKEVNTRASETDASKLADGIAEVISRDRRFAAGRNSLAKSSKAMPRLHDRHHLAHEFTGCQILLPDPLPAVRIFAWLASLPDSVIRAKALSRTTDQPDARYLFERVGTEICSDPLRVPIRDHVPSSAILIGADLEPEALLGNAREILGSSCSLG
jgi:G3E family GTPase